MLEQFGGFQQPFYFFPAQYNGQPFSSFDFREFDPFVFQPFGTVGKTKAIHGKLKIRIGWGVVLLLDQVEVVVDLVGVYFGGHLSEMKGQFGQVAAVAAKGAFALACNNNFLTKFFIK